MASGVNKPAPRKGGNTEDKVMSKLDWAKAVGGALIAVPIMYVLMVVLLAMQP